MNKNQKMQLYLLGGLLGALFGIIASNLLIKSSESNEKPLKISSKQGFQIGLSALSFLKKLTDIRKKV